MPIETKKALAEAFYVLARKKSVDKITVKDVSDACGISRQSFYYHFQDILELVEWAVEQQIQEAVSRTLGQDDPVDAIEGFIVTSAESYGLMRKLLHSQRHEQFQKILVQGLQTYLQELLQHKQPELAVSRSDIEVATRFFACGIAGLILTYAGDKKLNSRRLAEQIFHFISGTKIQ